VQKLNLKEILKTAVPLLLICVCFTGAVAGVNAITAEPIAAGEKLAADLARQEIFPGAEFEEREGYAAAYAGGALAGFLFDTEGQGYGGPIRVMTAVDSDGSVNRIVVVSCDSETPGLGTKVANESFLGQFVGRNTTDDFDSVASATFSSRGVAEAVNKALEIFNEQVRGAWQNEP